MESKKQQIKKVEDLLAGIFNKSDYKKVNVGRKYRKQNIVALHRLVTTESEKNGLLYQQKEERILIHETMLGEKIYIQFPGKESTRENEKKNLVDFRPKVLGVNGEYLPDFTFQKIWLFIEQLQDKNEEILPLWALLNFKMSRMAMHDLVPAEREYPMEILTMDNDKIKKCESRRDIHIDWYEFRLPESLRSLLKDYGLFEFAIKKGQRCKCSIEAILYLLELIAQNEDCKYYYMKNGLASDDGNDDLIVAGRRSTFNTMLAFQAAIEGTYPLSSFITSLQQGVVRSFSIDEVMKITNKDNSLIRVADRDKTLF